jgi:Homing endonuclease associated repeat
MRAKVERAFELNKQGRPLSEIADELGVSQSTVREYFYDPTREKARARESRLARGERRLKRWTNDEVLDAIRRYHEQHGRLPSAHDWKSPEEGFPSSSLVTRRFGTWSEGIAQAGFKPRGYGQRDSASVEALIAEIRDLSRWGAAPEIKGRASTVASLLRDRGVHWAEACELAGVRPRSAGHMGKGKVR